MTFVIHEKCPACEKEFAVDTETYYWHLKIHLAKIELKQINEEVKNGKTLGN